MKDLYKESSSNNKTDYRGIPIGYVDSSEIKSVKQTISNEMFRELKESLNRLKEQERNLSILTQTIMGTQYSGSGNDPDPNQPELKIDEDTLFGKLEYLIRAVRNLENGFSDSINQLNKFV